MDFFISHPRQQATACADLYYRGPPMENFWGDAKQRFGESRLVVIGHRGCGKNRISASGEIPASRPSIMENTITSFNTAAVDGADFVEFDVQVTKDLHPIVFHDDHIVVTGEQEITVKRISELTLKEFLSIGYQKHSKTTKVLLREAVDGSFPAWTSSIEDSLCTLQDCFEQVSPSIGFNIELKFNDRESVAESEIRRSIDATLEVVSRCAKDRKIYFSSFHPDAVQILRREQSSFPVFFLTDGGVNLYLDPRRNSIEAAIEICRKGGLQGIVTEVKAILQNPEAVNLMHDAGLCVLTYGEMNNVPEAMRKQEERGVEGVIVDDVQGMVVEARRRKAMAVGKSEEEWRAKATATEAESRPQSSSSLLLKAVQA